MHIELTSDDLNYIRAALTLVIPEREVSLNTGRLGKELGSETPPQLGRSAEDQEKLRGPS